MRFVPYEEAVGRPHVVVDGAATDGTVLTLSHWPGAATPPALLADTSAEIVLRHLAAPEIADLPPEVEAVTNNHFDEDGLLGVWALLAAREEVWAVADRVVAAARAGDFGVVEFPEGARAAFALTALARLSRAATPAGVYEELLPLVGSVLRSPERFERHWRPAWDAYEADAARLGDGQVVLRERPEVDLAVVEDAVDAAALRTATPRMRLLHRPRDRRYRVEYRYETWVRYVSRPLAPRVDLAPLARELQAMEDAPGRWTFDGVADLTPALWLERPAGEPAPSRIPPERFEAAVVEFLAAHQERPELQWRPG